MYISIHWHTYKYVCNTYLHAYVYYDRHMTHLLNETVSLGQDKLSLLYLKHKVCFSTYTLQYICNAPLLQKNFPGSRQTESPPPKTQLYRCDIQDDALEKPSFCVCVCVCVVTHLFCERVSRGQDKLSLFDRKRGISKTLNRIWLSHVIDVNASYYR